MTDSTEKTTETTEAPQKAERIKQHGVTRPRADSKTGLVWKIADEQTEALGGKPARRKDVLQECAEHGLVASTAATQYGRWRKFNGLEGRGDEAEEDAEEDAEPTATVIED